MHFDIDENRIAESGTKKLYIAIKGPDGSMLGKSIFGSGMMNTYDGKSINYSIEKDINLKQNEAMKNVVVNWRQEGAYKKGMYDVAIYNEGYTIGEGTAALK
jgi:hypothetical protein